LRFFPLAMAEMGGEGVCVAGVDVDTEEWIRPVAASYRCVFRDQAKEFEPNHYHELALAGRQGRSPDVDPERRHSEDRVLRGGVAKAEPIAPCDKLSLLQRLCEPDLRSAIRGGGRSLFLVEPRRFHCSPTEGAAYRWEFSAAGTDTAQLREYLGTQGSMVGMSTRGCKSTCPFGNRFVSGIFGRPICQDDIQHLGGGPRLFLTLSLTAVEYGHYWLVVAGIHIVGENRIWL